MRSREDSRRPLSVVRMLRVLLFTGMVAVCHLSGCKSSSGADHVCFQGRCVDVEVVRTPKERMRGLQGRTSLGQDEGMLFIFDLNQPQRFWMKDTLIPLDMIWLDFARRVVHIEHNVPPCVNDPCPSYGPRAPVLYVLEVNAGKAREMDLAVGAQMEFRLSRK